MAGYKVSYKVLSQQQEELKTVAKLMDDYTSRLDTIRGKLGSDDMFASVRQNLQKLSQQLGESRAVLTLSGQVISQCVGGYSDGEKTVVQKVDAARAHNRDFYKNPVTVASAGGVTVAGTGAGAAAVSAESPAISYTDNVRTSPETGSEAVSSATTADQLSTSAETVTTNGESTSGMSAGLVGFTTAAGIAAGAGGLFGVQKLKSYLKQKEGVDPAEATAKTPEENPEVLLAKALEEAEKYRQPMKSANDLSVPATSDSTPKFGMA